MENLQYAVVNNKGEKAGSVTLNQAIFAAGSQEGAVHEVVTWQLASRRSGTHATLRKGEMGWGRKKPWKQKGTGRARAGSSTSPIWVGGGVAHGPQPRDYSYKLPKRKIKAAICTVLSEKARKGELLIVDSVNVDSGKTRDLLDLLKVIGVGANSAVILTEGDAASKKLEQAAQNLKSIRTLSVQGLNVYELLRHKMLVVTKNILPKIEERLGECAEATKAE